MHHKKMTVVQCWDDGVGSDARLTEILRRHKARASFNLCAGLHVARRSPGWISSKGNEITRLGWDEMAGVYAGFTIANHSLSHPHLEQLAPDAIAREIQEGRARLQQFFQQPVLGFAYPNGSYNQAVIAALRAAGHVYARTTQNVAQPFPPADPMEFHPSCHFLAADFWERYESAREGGVFYFWGHSYEMIGEAMWSEMDGKIARISADPAAQWGDLPTLFDG